MVSTAKTNLDGVERRQREAARVITGCLRSTPVEDLAKEADLIPLEHRGRELAAKAAYKHLSHLPEYPLQPMLEGHLNDIIRPARRRRQ